jgi:hypothetical protein
MEAELRGRGPSPSARLNRAAPTFQARAPPPDPSAPYAASPAAAPAPELLPRSDCALSQRRTYLPYQQTLGRAALSLCQHSLPAEDFCVAVQAISSFTGFFDATPQDLRPVVASLALWLLSCPARVPSSTLSFICPGRSRGQPPDRLQRNGRRFERKKQRGRKNLHRSFVMEDKRKTCVLVCAHARTRHNRTLSHCPLSRCLCARASDKRMNCALSLVPLPQRCLFFSVLCRLSSSATRNPPMNREPSSCVKTRPSRSSWI